MKKLGRSFYLQTDVVSVAQQLVGKMLYTQIDEVITAGRIVETEAYKAFTDKACHAFAGRRTPRNEHMYGEGGTAYVYICYGMHHLFNVVTNAKDVPDAVLIRAIEPVHGIEHMLQRRKLSNYAHHITRGPGSLSIALGIHNAMHSGISLSGNQIWITEGALQAGEQLVCSKRIGVESAGADALLPWRFFVNKHPNVSAIKTGTPVEKI